MAYDKKGQSSDDGADRTASLDDESERRSSALPTPRERPEPVPPDGGRSGDAAAAPPQETWPAGAAKDAPANPPTEDVPPSGEGEEDGEEDGAPEGAMKRSVPPVIDFYRILRPIGRGGGGMVFLAYDTLLRRYVAIKFLTRQRPTEYERKRMLNEAKAVAQLQHPNVVSIYQVGELRGEPYLVTEYIEGESLRQLKKPVSGPRLCEIALGLARGLAAAHRKGILHRDVKASNAMLRLDGEVKLIDFGLAKRTQAEWGEMEAARQAEGGSAGSADVSAVRDDAPRTRAGAILGTTVYMAPELFGGERASYRSDVYSLGTVLYELAVGTTPAEELDLSRPPRHVTPLGERVPGIDPAFAVVVDRCLAREPGERFASAEEVWEALERIAGASTPAVPHQKNPYRGLERFEREHRALFFGRETEIKHILERLRGDPLVVVAGDSGLGKSSLCRAGVLPCVEDGALDGTRHWTVRGFVPGRSPLAALAEVFAEVMTGRDASTWARLLGEDPARAVRELCACLGREAGLVLFVDQMEELFTLAAPAEAAQAGEVLGELVANAAGGLRVLGTVRGDYLGRLAALGSLGREPSRALHLLRPLSAEQARRAIVAPAYGQGVGFESEALIGELVASAGQAGGLPLLSFALAQLWDKRDLERRIIPRAALSELGGVAGALAKHGDGVIACLRPAAQQAARRILLELTTADGTRARKRRGELGAAEDTVTAEALDALVQGRLVVATGTGEGVAYEIAHEALLQGWGRLRDWLEADRGLRPVRQRLAAAVVEWERHPEALWGEQQLEEARGLQVEDVSAREWSFLEASRRAVHERRRRRWMAYGGAVFASVLLVVAWVSWDRMITESKIRAILERTNELLAGSRRLQGAADAERTEALKQFDTMGDSAQRQQAEERWSRSRGLAEQAEAERARAAEVLLGAIHLAPQREALRSQYGGILYEGIIAAEKWGRFGQVRELSAALRYHDPQGSWQRRLEAPAELAIDVQPREAKVVLERYEDRDGHFEARRVEEWSGMPLRRTLPPGSYRLSFRAPGRAPVRLPILLERGEQRPVAFTLPLAAQVPEGYVYVPPGRFYFGASDDDVRVNFFRSPPEHAVDTGDYLIARMEVTQGEWIEHLESLPPDERRNHLPRGDFAGVSIALEELSGGGWRFHLQTPQKRFSVRRGELIEYPGRALRAKQDWLRFPVAGISREDALGYLAWLDRTGRVPGARLCTEQEWERAARGADRRSFPHGNRLLPDDANFDETYGRKSYGPDAVGSHPRSASPFGLEDMAGNVWEWVRPAVSDQDVVGRSGSWWEGGFGSRIANRQISEKSVRDALIGFRVCAPLPAEAEQTPERLAKQSP